MGRGKASGDDGFSALLGRRRGLSLRQARARSGPRQSGRHAEAQARRRRIFLWLVREGRGVDTPSWPAMSVEEILSGFRLSEGMGPHVSRAHRRTMERDLQALCQQGVAGSFQGPGGTSYHLLPPARWPAAMLAAATPS